MTTTMTWRRRRFHLGALLSLTAVLYLWGLGASGWANEFYAAAVQAGTHSWKALLFGSLDAGNAITVDKPPASLWVMALSGKIFGFSAWSMLVPQALMGIGSVALVYAAVTRWSGHASGLLAGTALALTPVAALMFRFNNPDALLVLLLVAGAYCVVRAIDAGSTWWLAFAGVAVGFGFLAKLLQAFLVLPAFGLVFLLAAPGGTWKRVRQLLVATVAMIVSGGWLVALVELWPAGSRPYIGGSTTNSLWELAMGYNGFGRILGGDGNGSPGGGGGGGNTGFGGATGMTRLFGASLGTEISWLLPVALLGLLAGLWFTRRGPRTDRTRAALVLWGGWLVVTGIVFSFMSGTMHPYYTVALAPAVAALVGVGVCETWRRRDTFAARVILGSMMAATGVWNFILLDRTGDWLPWLRWTLLVGSIAAASMLVVGGHIRKFAVVLAATGLLFGLGGTAAYAVETAVAPHSGSIPTSGPVTDGLRGAGGPGGVTDNAELENLLTSTETRWAAATVGAHSAGSLELKTGSAVIAIGGFSGSDNAPTLAQFQHYVATGQVRYFILDGGMGGGPERGGADNAGSQITAWVRSTFAPTTVGGTTVYDLTSAIDGVVGPVG